MISIRFDLRSFGFILLALLCIAVSPGVASAQQTGEWIVIDGKHEGRSSSVPGLVAAADRGHYVVMTREDIAIGPYTIRRTSDGGSTWQIVRADSGQTWRIVDLAYPTPSTIFAAGDSGGNAFVLRSVDAGATWDRHDFVDGLSMRSFTMFDALSGAIITSKYSAQTGTTNRLRVTSDGGSTWSVRDLPDDTLSIGSIFSRAAGSYLIIANDYPAKLTFAHMTSDAGLTWQTHSLPAGISAIDFAGEQLGIGVGGLSTGVGHTRTDLIARTTDGGRSWTKVIDKVIDFRFGLNDVALADARHGIAVGSNGKIHRTSDGGLTWQQEWPPSYVVSEYAGMGAVAYPVADEALATTGSASYVLKYTGRQRLVAPTITAPVTNMADLPLEMEIAWTPVEGALWYDLQIGDTTYEYNIVNHHVFDDPYIDAAGLTVTSHMVFLEPNTRYEMRVRARNQSDTSDWSLRRSAISRQSSQSLLTPGFISPPEGATDVPVPTRLEWSEVAGATGYDLMVSDNPAFMGDDVTSLTGHAASSYETALKPNTTYYAIVRARNAGEVGNWSNLNEGKRTFTTGGTSRVEHRRDRHAARLSTSPNPVTGGSARITVEREVAGTTTLRLIDAQGISFLPFYSGSLPSDATTITLDLSGYPAGTWFIRMDDEQGSVVEKIVKVE